MSFITKLMLIVVIAAFLMVVGVFAPALSIILTSLVAAAALYGVTIDGRRLIDVVIAIWSDTTEHND